MDIEISQAEAIYCDIGPNAGVYRIDIAGSVYLTPGELGSLGPEGLRVTVAPQMSAPFRQRLMVVREYDVPDEPALM